MCSKMKPWSLEIPGLNHSDINELSPDKLREVVLKFNEQNAFDEMILAPKKKF